jgi:hypothetical protein
LAKKIIVVFRNFANAPKIITRFVCVRVAYVYIVRGLKGYAFSDGSEQSGYFLSCSQPTAEETAE